MEKYGIIFGVLLFFILALGVTTGSTAQKDVVQQTSIYGELLTKHVHNGFVDYRGFKNEEEKLNQYLRELEKTDSSGLSGKGQFAFYINAYNAWALKLILDHYPGIKPIKEAGSFFKSPWKKKICRIDGDMISLDNIEHKILRARFKDPRVHFAINCASKSCPPLRSEPCREDVLDMQLNDQAANFINNPAKRCPPCGLPPLRLVAQRRMRHSEKSSHERVDRKKKYDAAGLLVYLFFIPNPVKEIRKGEESQW